MLRITQNSAPQGAKSYYSTSDYYSEGQELTGRWRGDGAARLGLSGAVQQKDWDALCDNLNPETGKVVTPRQKQHRRVGYDFNFHVPKSLSVLYGLTKDERILDAFRDSVDATMQDMEAEMKTRVRMAGNNEDRTTGNMVWGDFVHTTARPVDGVPDPHLHAHCFVFNTTWDDKESRWKAGQFADLKRDAPFFEAVFHSRLARRLEENGLRVERTKHGWELAGMPASAIEKFSRRTALIEGKAREKGITNADAKGELGAKTRERKRKDLTFDELGEQWRSRLSPAELDAVKTLRSRLGDETIAEDDRVAGDAIARAVAHCFERSSVVAERKLMTQALKRSLGAASPATVVKKLATQALISGDRSGQKYVTTKTVLEEERGMIDFARKGRGTCKRLGESSHAFKRDWLNDGQRKAVQHVLTSPDRVILVRGAAGTGKTSIMQETVEAIEANGKRVHTFAPSANASRGVLREDGFDTADTVARLLKDERMQADIQGQVIWIDEAGLLGTRTTAQVFELAAKLDTRVILSGDRKQHGSVERGAALRLLEEEAGLVPVEIREIQRQKGQYKQAVQALSEGKTAKGFRQLDKLGWVKEVTETERYKTLAEDYVATVKQGKSALVVSPTHREGEWITDEIRSNLKRAGRLGKGERRFRVLHNANLTEADRTDLIGYREGDVLVFHQNARGYRKGQRVTVTKGAVPVNEAARFQVFHPDILPIAPGDVLRITRNGMTADEQHRLNNGAIFTVKDFDAQGDIILTNGWTVAKDFGHVAYGYVVTSHASQGKTVDRVFIGESSTSYPAASREQFYVSISRGRERATIYTDDKKALLEAVSRSDDRLTATEMIGERQISERGAALQRMEQLLPAPERAPQPGQERLTYER
jgi:conjugative relaxase-like TrwC/TraI family protein